MIDLMTNKPMRIEASPTGPSLQIYLSQVDEIKKALDRHGIRRYWVSENVISFNGGPEITRIWFGHGGDAKAIQAALDSVECDEEKNGTGR